MSGPTRGTEIHAGQDAFLERYSATMMRTFGTPARVLVRGEGPYVFDVDGGRYLDLLGGIAVNALGHAHPRLVAAIADQAGRLMHISNLFTSPQQVELGERLAALASGIGARAGSPDADVPARVFLANSGTEANEAALKATRRTGRTRIIAMEGAFHGRSMGALSVTANPAYREPFEPLPGGATWVPYGDADALDAALDDTVAAVLVAPSQGESGVVVPPDGWLSRVRELTAARGVLLWLDEVQTGVGRCGTWFACEAEGVVPDLVTLAKGLGGGFPVGACIALGEATALLQAGHHGSTFGGNPLAARAALEVLDVIADDGLLEHVRTTGDWLAAEVEALGLPEVDHVRGRGLLRGIVLRAPEAPAIAARALEAGFIVNAPRPDVLRLAPPLIVTPHALAPFVHALPRLVRGHA